MPKTTNWKINDVLNILLEDIGISKFETRQNHIKIEFPRRRTYTNLWVSEDLPWTHPCKCPRKWDDLDDKLFKDYLLQKYGEEATFTVIKDAVLCLKSRLQVKK